MLVEQKGPVVGARALRLCHVSYSDRVPSPTVLLDLEQVWTGIVEIPASQSFQGKVNKRESRRIAFVPCTPFMLWMCGQVKDPLGFHSCGCNHRRVVAPLD
jgi:hypothetical protein